MRQYIGAVITVSNIFTPLCLFIQTLLPSTFKAVRPTLYSLMFTLYLAGTIFCRLSNQTWAALLCAIKPIPLENPKNGEPLVLCTAAGFRVFFNFKVKNSPFCRTTFNSR